jgi:hypothetical protein
MQMIGHHHELIDFDTGKPRRNAIPQRGHHLPGLVEAHRTGDHVAEQAGPVLRADGDEIRTGHGIIVAPEAKAETAMHGRTARHQASVTTVT